MMAFNKWLIAIACVSVTAWLWLDPIAIDISPAQEHVPSASPLPNNMAEQQLADGIALWRDNQYQQASHAFSLLNAQDLSPSLQSLSGLYEYHASAFNENRNSDFIQHLSTLPDDCKQKLLFVTPDIRSLMQAEHFRLRFAQDPRLKSLSICIYDVTWFDPVDIICDENWHESGRLGCQLLSVAEKLKSLPLTHLVMFADKGKANVHNGVMFLDRMDTYDVFIHELAHFSGFIDEYPLSKGLAKRVCAGVDAPNMVFKKIEELDIDRQYWQSIGLQNNTDIFAARTCDNHSTQAFKASGQLTFMEFHDVAYIPANYLAAWQKQLQKTPNQPSVHINFAQLHEQSNNLSESHFWRTRYEQYLKSNSNSVTML